MYVEYDSTRVFFFLPPAAFLGALADFLEGVLAILMICVWFAKLRDGQIAPGGQKIFVLPRQRADKKIKLTSTS